MRTLLLVLLPAKLLLWITSQTLWGCSEAFSPQFVGPSVRGLCQAQCLSWCYDLGPNKCDFKCEGSQEESVIPPDVEWKVNCSKSWGNYDMECVGTCSIISVKERGYIPAKPDVYVLKDALTSSYTLRWQPDIYVTPNTVYVVSQLEMVQGEEEWRNIGIVKGGEYRVGYVDICTPPAFRVAAVNRYGSRWYSDRTGPVNIPGRPKNITLLNLEYDKLLKQIKFVLHWNGPTGWKSDELDVEHDIIDMLECPPNLDKAYVMKEAINGYMVVGINGDSPTIQYTGYLSENAIGCTVDFQISARSICNKTWVGIPAQFNMEINCSNVKGYDGSICKAPPVLSPGPVSHLKLTLIWLYNGIMGLVSWQPPLDLGSAGRVGHYHIFYGIVDLKSMYKVFKKTPEHKIVNSNTFSVDIFSNITTLKSFETIGVMVRAAAPGQSFKDNPGGPIVFAENTRPPMHIRAGTLISDDNTIVVVTSPDTKESPGQSGVGVQVFWRRPNETMTFDIANYAVELGVLRFNHSTTDGFNGFEPPTMNRTQTNGA